MKKYRVAYVTGTRADWGIVRKYLSFLNDDGNIVFSVLVTGTHLESSFGYTADEIRKDGFAVEKEFPLNIKTNTTSDILCSMSVALRDFGAYFEKNKFDLVIVLGDRYEIMAAAIAAAMQKIPLLHLHGGEITLGNYDEFIRHSITKMSTFHFTSTEEYRKRVIQLGEKPQRVFNLGALGAENCRNIDEEKVDNRILSLKKDGYFTVLYHPETLIPGDVKMQAKTILSAISKFSRDYKIVLIGSNADTGAGEISNIFRKRADEDERYIYFDSLSSDSYLYLLKHSVMLIGNSSSGIIEAPSLDTYTVNIGRRQDGRIRADSVIDVECDEIEITNAIDSILKGESIKTNNPYYQENAAWEYYKKTLEILSTELQEPKKFYDITTP